VLVIGENGDQLGVMSSDEALAIAQEQGMDLVEVAPMARPPVCRLMDYGRHKYETKKRASEAKKNATQIQLKEVKMRPKTDDHDRDTKVRHIRRFLEEGNKAKVTMRFRGREVVHAKLAEDMLKEIAQELTDIGIVEQPAKLEGKQMTMILAPGK
jgi:translation initiation factor IF-3